MPLGRGTRGWVRGSVRRHSRFVMAVVGGSWRSLHPDVLLSDSTVAPFGDGHHPLTTFDLTDHASPVSRSETDRVGRDLHWRTTGGIGERLHGIYVLLDAVGLRLPVDIYEDVVGV